MRTLDESETFDCYGECISENASTAGFLAEVQVQRKSPDRRKSLALWLNDLSTKHIKWELVSIR